ncbi:hypothetical protein KP79_PYT17582 [Mizuhopecten yessoensis]|uniref:Uncharacterized protein n=1 Tax=Mizuhopecten yessoensis TaxID=6573 RepID=A0A210QG84_MIZYE|nr:hypothetical protein KP79_PYT17582 [Mizuhopecten yessoensis]
MASPSKKGKGHQVLELKFLGMTLKKDAIQGKMQNVRTFLTNRLNKPVGNVQAPETILEFWTTGQQDESMDLSTMPAPSTYLKASKKKVDQKLFLCAEESLQNLVKVVEHHSEHCKEHLQMKKPIQKGHVLKAQFQCDSQKLAWSSSPYLPDKGYLVNDRVQHGFICSGMLPSHYAKFNKINKQTISHFFKSYQKHIQDEYNNSISTALLEEIGLYEDESLGSVDMMTDARHRWRKNAKDTSVVAIGDRTHKVINCQHVTKADDNVSQRHENWEQKRYVSTI